MSDFDGQIWIAQDNDEVNFICITKRVKNKIQAISEKGRELRLLEDKLLWQCPSQARDATDWQTQLTHIQTQVDSLYNEIDIALLWETALELELSEIKDLAELYFTQEITPIHFVAIWRVLANDRIYFKRRGQVWEARSAQQIEELKTQRQREQARAQAQAIAKEWLQTVAKSSLPAFPNFSDNDESNETFQLIEPEAEILPFLERLEGWLLRNETDKEVEDLINQTASSVRLIPREFAFETLQKVGRLATDADRDVIVAGLKPEFSQQVNEVAQMVQPWCPVPAQTITELPFSIDDEETREVDDALGIEREAGQWKIVIAIADPASVVHRGDILDREAMRRGTTVYLPTQTVLMLPPRISCDVASLTAEQVRSSLVIRAWVDEQGQLRQSDISREPIKVLKRLHYSDADQLIHNGNDETAQNLQELLTLARRLHAQRITQGAFTLQRPEYKVRIQDGTINVAMINRYSPSRVLVAEMMILANYIAAKYAQSHQLPVIYRCQNPPLEPITEEMLADPLGFYKVRQLLGRSSLSLQPGGHSGLGLPLYTQLTSPLRRFADLVIQRQLMAHLQKEELPYDQEELYKVLETAERTARESRMVESEAKKRWLLQYLKQFWGDEPIEALVLMAVKGGYKVEMLPWAVEAFLNTDKELALGETVDTVIDKIRVKASNTRLRLQ